MCVFCSGHFKSRLPAKGKTCSGAGWTEGAENILTFLPTETKYTEICCIILPLTCRPAYFTEYSSSSNSRLQPKSPRHPLALELLWENKPAELAGFSCGGRPGPRFPASRRGPDRSAFKVHFIRPDLWGTSANPPSPPHPFPTLLIA